MISRAPGLKIVVETLISSLKPIGNIVLIAATFFIIFGILGVQVNIRIVNSFIASHRNLKLEIPTCAHRFAIAGQTLNGLASWTQVGRMLDASWTQVARKPFHCSIARMLTPVKTIPRQLAST